MNTLKIQGETPFQVNAHSFACSPSNEGYTLNYSADGVNFTAWSASTPSNETLIVNSIAKSMYFKLVGNNSEITVRY